MSHSNWIALPLYLISTNPFSLRGEVEHDADLPVHPGGVVEAVVPVGALLPQRDRLVAAQERGDLNTMARPATGGEFLKGELVRLWPDVEAAPVGSDPALKSRLVLELADQVGPEGGDPLSVVYPDVMKRKTIN